ncbi:MAG: hypothetical protein HY651_09020 [Acidobacteria bacterium]|nr:hypothetical protein [Acidobacteriota bacterium]
MKIVPKKLHKISPTHVRYIKLGEGGKWEKECLKKEIIRFGFGSSNSDRFPLCRAGQWKDLKKSFLVAGKTKGTATRFTNETRRFFEDDGSMLWLTFMGDILYWGRLAPHPPMPHSDGDGVWRTVEGGWCCTDLNGEQLKKERLSGALTKLAAYRGTSCGVEAKKYLIRRINGEKTPEIERAVLALGELKHSALDLMRLLGPQDFETLVDLVFSTSGWRRQGIIGKTQKTLDLDLFLPSTGERAFVQVKSKTTSSQLAEYIGKFEELGSFDRMFYVYHSGEAETDDDRVTIIGPERLAELVMDSGLANWLIRKVS